MIARIPLTLPDPERDHISGSPDGFFINGERYDGARDLKHLLNAPNPQTA